MKARLRVYRKVFRFVVFTLTILTANLLNDFLNNYLVSFKNYWPKIPFTLFAMAILVIIFYPAFQVLDYWIAKISKNVVETGKSVAGKYLGLFLAFFIALLILTYLYLQVWYNVNIFDSLLKGQFKQLF